MSTMPSKCSILASSALALTVIVSRAEARPRDAEPSFLPPAPEDRRAVRGVETRFLLPIPAYVRPLCPRGSDCILGVGGGLGVVVERRFQSGFSLGVSYELQLMSAEAVYELTTMQAVGFRAQWTMQPERSAHATLALQAGATTLDDILRPRTVGVFGAVGVGAELEMSQNLAFTIGLDARLAAFIPYDSQPDDVRRSVSPFVTVTPVLRAGILWLAPRARAR